MTTFTQELFNTICERIAGGESLRAICRDKDMPNIVTVWRWINAEGAEELSKQYARAREAQADAFADEVVEIADTEEDPQRARVRIDARKWSAGKMKPKVYGDKIAVGGDSSAPPIQTEEVGAPVRALLQLVRGIAERNREAGEPTGE